MTKSPAKAIIAAILIILLIRNLFNMFLGGGSDAELTTGEAIGELMGELLINGLLAFIIAILLKKDKPKNTNTEQQP